MIGQLGEGPVAAVGAAGRPLIVTMTVIWAISHGTGILSSQYWGRKNSLGVGKSVVQAVMFSFALLLPVFLLFRFWPESVVRLATDNKEVVELGRHYLSIVSFNLITLSVTLSMYAGLRSINQAVKCTIFSMISVILNIGLDYVLIFGKLGFPALGIKGAALASMTSTLCEAVLILLYLNTTNHILKITREVLKKALNRSDFKRYFTITYPMVLNGLAWSAGIYIYFIIYGHMGKQQLAVMTMFSPMESFCIAFFGGIYTGAGIILGHHLGKRDFDRAWKESWLFVILSVITGIVLFFLFLLMRETILGFFNNMEPGTLVMARQVYSVFLVFILCKSINTVVINGVLRSGADTRFILALDAGCQWLVAIPLAYSGAFVWHLELRWVFAFVICEEIVKIFICTGRMYSRAWMRSLVDAEERQPAQV